MNLVGAGFPTKHLVEQDIMDDLGPSEQDTGPSPDARRAQLSTSATTPSTVLEDQGRTEIRPVAVPSITQDTNKEETLATLGTPVVPEDKSKSTTTPPISEPSAESTQLGTPSSAPDASLAERKAARTFERLIGSLDRLGGHSMEADISGWVIESWSNFFLNFQAYL